MIFLLSLLPPQKDQCEWLIFRIHNNLSFDKVNHTNLEYLCVFILARTNYFFNRENENSDFLIVESHYNNLQKALWDTIIGLDAFVVYLFCLKGQQLCSLISHYYSRTLFEFLVTYRNRNQLKKKNIKKTQNCYHTVNGQAARSKLLD